MVHAVAASTVGAVEPTNGSAAAVAAPADTAAAPVDATAEAENPFAALAEEARVKTAGERVSAPPSPRDAWLQDFERRSWEWHLFSTKLIFFLVVGIVAFGMFIAWLQFRHDTDLQRDRSKGDDADYDMSASLQSVSIKSKTIGAVILLASAGFFLMYLIHVYPMEPL